MVNLIQKVPKALCKLIDCIQEALSYLLESVVQINMLTIGALKLD